MLGHRDGGCIDLYVGLYTTLSLLDYPYIRSFILNLRALDRDDLVPEGGYTVGGGAVLDGIDAEEGVALAEELLPHRAILLLAGGVEHCKNRG